MSQTDQTPETEERIKQYPGRLIDTFPTALSQEKPLAHTAKLMQHRIANTPNAWDYYDTPDLIAHPPKQLGLDEARIILTTDSQGRVTETGRPYLERIREDNLTHDKAAKLENYEEVQGPGIIKVQRSKIITGTRLTQQQILEQQFLRTLARHKDEVPEEFAENENLLEEYEKEVRTKTGHPENMAIYLDDSTEEAKLRAVCVGSLGSWSDVVGYCYLVYSNGRLAGLASETPQPQDAAALRAPNLDEVLALGKDLPENLRTPFEEKAKKLYAPQES